MQKIIKIAIYVIISVLLLNSLVFIGLALYKTIHAYTLIVQGRIEEKPGLFIGEALDGFLVSLFFIIFSIGISKLFLPDKPFIKGYDLPWLKVENFSGLKFIIWEMLLTTLFVYFSVEIILREDNPDWTMLIIPASILMLSLAYKFLKHGH